jgi:hypothetical protein
LILRKLILVFILIAATLSLKAQDSYNYNIYGIGIYANSLRPYDDLKIANYTYSVTVAGYYNLSPYVPLGAEIQVGSISGGSIVNDFNKRQYNNHYKALVFHGDIALGQIVDYSYSLFWSIAKDFYVGSGAGFIYNDMAFIQRTNLNPTGYPVGGYTFPGSNASLNFMVPIRIGYEYKIYNDFGEPYMGINVGYIHNFTFGEGLDGYTDPPDRFRNNSPDQYRQIFIGIKFNFGPITAYTKQINYSARY